MMRACLSAAAIAATTVFLGAQPDRDWPQLYGTARNSTAARIGPDASLSIAWKTPMPTGSAGIVAAGDRVYTLGSDGEQDMLFALDAGTGKESWRVTLGQTHADAITNGPGGTPVISGDLVVAVSSRCQVQAVNSTTRRVAWTHDLGAEFASRFAKRGGCAVSPLLAGSRIVLVTGASQGPQLAAFDVATGTPAWTTPDLPNSYSVAPGWLAAAGSGLVLYHHNKPPGVSGVTAVNADTGAVAWQIDGVEGDSGMTPVTAGEGRIVLETWAHVSAYDIATRKPLWTTKAIAALGSPAIFRDGHIFTFGGQSGEFLTCVDAATGRSKWTSRVYRGHLALAGDVLVLLSESSGLLRLVAADPSAYRELTKIQVLEPGARTGTPPSIAGGRIFVRNLEEMVAVTVGRKAEG
jgi:outer membrane protein assembly factor BamB